MALPNLTDAERKAALEKAVEARRKRADFKDQISQRKAHRRKGLGHRCGRRDTVQDEDCGFSAHPTGHR